MIDYRQRLQEFLPAVQEKRLSKSDRQSVRRIDAELSRNESGGVRRDDDMSADGLCAHDLITLGRIAASYSRVVDWEWTTQEGTHWRATPALNGNWLILRNGVQSGGAPFDYTIGCSTREFDTLISALRYALFAA